MFLVSKWTELRRNFDIWKICFVFPILVLCISIKLKTGKPPILNFGPKKWQIEVFSWKKASEFHAHGRKSHQKTCTWPKFDQKWYTLICTWVEISCFVCTCTLHMIFFLFLKCACFLHMSWNLELCVTLLSVCCIIYRTVDGPLNIFIEKSEVVDRKVFFIWVRNITEKGWIY